MDRRPAATSGRQVMQWEGCSVLVYRWVLHLLNASNNLAYNRLPLHHHKPCMQPPSPHHPHHLIFNHHQHHHHPHVARSNPFLFFRIPKHVKIKSKGKRKSKIKSKCEVAADGSRGWKFMARGRHPLHLIPFLR